MRVHAAHLDELAPRTLYALLRLRVDVFVVEQACAYPELDGRDLEPDALHLWVTGGSDEEDVVACLRLLAEPGGGNRIGRVATRASVRRSGHAAALMARALELADRPVVLDAQSHLASWYEGLGFEVDGQAFVEDGIPHVPMRLG